MHRSLISSLILSVGVIYLCSVTKVSAEELKKGVGVARHFFKDFTIYGELVESSMHGISVRLWRDKIGGEIGFVVAREHFEKEEAGTTVWETKDRFNALQAIGMCKVLDRKSVDFYVQGGIIVGRGKYEEITPEETETKISLFSILLGTGMEAEVLDCLGLSSDFGIELRTLKVKEKNLALDIESKLTSKTTGMPYVQLKIHYYF